ncbi:protein of unknown function [Cupriavidus taiwanensis]|nr:protein of unknown function [Cupriavidus taiwanensis]
MLKSTRWLLLRNRENLSVPRRFIWMVLEANRPLLTVYLLRDELKRLWFYRRRRGRKKLGSNGASRLGRAEYLPWSCLRSACKATGMASWPAAATH